MTTTTATPVWRVAWPDRNGDRERTVWTDYPTEALAARALARKRTLGVPEAVVFQVVLRP